MMLRGENMRSNRPECVILLFFLFQLFTGISIAGDSREIELDDGSRIYGEIVSFQEGIYKIKSETLGTVDIEGSKILSIRSKKPCKDCKKTVLPMEGSVSAQLKAIKKNIVNDQDIMNMIYSLQRDPDFQQIMRDPEIVKALMSGDIESLTSNPKFMKLMDHQTVQEIGNKLSERKATSP